MYNQIQNPIINQHTIDMQKVVGKGYADYWNSRKRFVVCKGGKGSKKSRTTALKYIHDIMKYPLSNVLVCRRFFNSHKNSTFAELRWAINRLGVQGDWKISKSPMEITYLPTGQKILFAGLDDPDTLASVTVAIGYLCWVWIEEAFEIENEETFDKLNLSIRGLLPPHLWKQIRITFNPWSANHWLKRRFFDTYDPDVLAMTTTFRNNEFLDEADLKEMKRMQLINPKRYRIVGDGEWGISDGLIYNYRLMDATDPTVNELRAMREKGKTIYIPKMGMDFGFTNDPTAIIELLTNIKLRKIWVVWEHYQYAMTNDMIVTRLKQMFYDKRRIVADSAELKSIKEIKNGGIVNIVPAKKGPDSLRAGINKLQDYEIIVNPKCVNTIIEFNNYCWEKDAKTGRTTDRPIDEFNHSMDAIRYAAEDLKKSNFSFA